jgi:cystathionine beta-lyase/cystathionine gamma-synthase
VLYPGFADHPAHAIAAKQMKGFGGMVTVEIDGGFEATRRFCARLRVFSCAESLGGVESLCCHPASMTHGSIPRDVREARGITDALVRLSVGLEEPQDLIADLRSALA